MKKTFVFLLALLSVCCLYSDLAAQSADPFRIDVKPAKLTPAKKQAFQWLLQQEEELSAINHKIWSFAEVGMEEYRSSRLLVDYVKKQGFRVTWNVAGMPTAFVAEYGSGEPVLGILAEYDALPGLSQAEVPYKEPLIEGGAGHGCGHNIFGTASAAAAAALKNVMERNHLAGTIRLFGCPAEEIGVGKAFMAREGVFDGLSCCLQWHPGSSNSVSLGSSNAINQFEVEFFGKSAHAAGDPWSARSALDAVELTNVGLNYLREHLKPTARIHYVITDGGDAPNIVPDYARAWYFVRNIDRESLEQDYARVLDIIDGAAKMSGTTYKIHFNSGAHEMISNRTGNEIIYSNLLLVGPPEFTSEEQEYAREIQKNCSVATSGLKSTVEELKIPQRSWGGGSTDVAEVSWLTPTTNLSVVAKPDGTPGHHWSTVACGGMSIGHKSMLTAAKVMAAAGLDLLTHPEQIKRMRAEWKRDMAGKTYRSPMPPDMLPPVKPEKK